jgi:uncharacterized protein
MYRAIFFLLISFACSIVGADQQIPGFSEKKYVNDATHSLSSEEISSLEEKLRKLDQEQEEGVQLVVVVIPTLEGKNIENTAQVFMTRWQIGSKERDSGCLLLIAVQDKSSYIELGYGLAGRIDEKTASDISQNVINPYLEKGQVATAVQNGVKAIFSAIGVDFNASGTYKTTGWWEKTSLLFCFINVVLLFLLARFSSSRYWWLSPIIGFAIGITQSFGFAVVMSVFAGVMVLICIILRKRFQR